ncbi:uncharacterized protein UBRO2_05906 [Ustilago bromivora]|uniref:Peptidase A1 domain-containing protein n=1 Tax=Ustilago bromivora TaxID=307758 RepID=A0A8H8TVI1_9BASI|nr:uncharacterized protein UBRO2_05906 [Ustilago bromivora]
MNLFTKLLDDCEGHQDSEAIGVLEIVGEECLIIWIGCWLGMCMAKTKQNANMLIQQTTQIDPYKWQQIERNVWQHNCIEVGMGSTMQMFSLTADTNSMLTWAVDALCKEADCPDLMTKNLYNASKPMTRKALCSAHEAYGDGEMDLHPYTDAVEGASDAARSAADVVFLDEGISTIITLIKKLVKWQSTHDDNLSTSKDRDAFLKPCFRFLCVPGYHASSWEWQAILHLVLAPALVCVSRTIGTHHTKAQVASEMSLPLQTQCTIPINFTSIEAAFYADVWKDALDDIGYGSEGSPRSNDHQVDVAKMCNQLLLFRQACTHPQVTLQFRGGVVGSRNLRNIDKVLELMIDSTRPELHSTRTHWFDRCVHRNILSLYCRDEDTRLLAASQFRGIEDEINKGILGLEQEIHNAAIVGPLYHLTNLELEMEQKAEARRKRLGGSDGKDNEGGDQALQAVVQDLEAYQALQQKRKVRINHITQLKALLRSPLMKLQKQTFANSAKDIRKLKTAFPIPDQGPHSFLPKRISTPVASSSSKTAPGGGTRTSSSRSPTHSANTPTLSTIAWLNDIDGAYWIERGC